MKRNFIVLSILIISSLVEAQEEFFKYEVKRQDTLSHILYELKFPKIYGKNGYLKKVVALNNLNGQENNLSPGQVIVIPKYSLIENNRDLASVQVVEKNKEEIKEEVKFTKKFKETFHFSFFLKSLELKSKGSDLGGYNATVGTKDFYGIKLSTKYDGSEAFTSFSKVKFETRGANVSVVGSEVSFFEFGLSKKIEISNRIFASLGAESRKIFYTKAYTQNNFKIESQGSLSPKAEIKFGDLKVEYLPILSSGYEVRLFSQYGDKVQVKYGVSHAEYKIQNNENRSLSFEMSVEVGF